MRIFAYLRRLPSALRLVVRPFPAAFKPLTDRLFRYRREYQVPETWRNARLQLIPLEPRLVPSVVNGEVWSDLNGNKAIDMGEPAESGIAVNLTGGSLSVNENTSTDGSGDYTFSGLAGGTYTLSFTAPAGYTYDTPDDPTEGEDIFSLGSGSGGGSGTGGSATVSVDAGLVAPASIGGVVWYDTNANDAIDGDEFGTPGVSVTLTGSELSGAETAVTDGGGNYIFIGLPIGTYTVSFAAQTGYAYDTPASGHTTAAVTSGENDTSVSAGLIMTTPATVKGEVWYDRNQNDVIDGGETVAPGVGVTLTGGNLTSAVTTDTNGSGDYTFTDVNSVGPYTLSFGTVAGYTYDTPEDYSPGQDSFTVSEGETLTVSAGLVADTSISGEVWFDTNHNDAIDSGELPASGMSVTLTGGDLTATERTITNSGGNYSFTELDPGTYTVSFAPQTGYTYDTPSAGLETISLTAGENDTSVSAGLIMTTPATVKGEVWYDTNFNQTIDAGETVASGVAVTLTGGDLTAAETTNTNGSGDYTFSGLDTEGPYTLNFGTVTGYTYDTPDNTSPGQDTFSVTEGETLSVSAGLFAQAIVEGEVWSDLNGNKAIDSGEPGVSAVAVTLTGGNLTAAEITSTNGSGNYTFTGLDGDSTYTLSFGTHAGYTYNTPDNPSLGQDTFSLSSGETLTVTAGLVGPATLGGEVWYDLNANTVIDSGEPSATAVAVTLTGSELTAAETTITNASGDYSFTGLAIGTYTVSFAPQSGYTYDTPASGHETVSLTSAENDTSASAGLVAPASVGGEVWFDTNHNDAIDSGELAASGMSVTLTGSELTAAETTITNAGGNYSFTGLPVGTYTVSFAAQTGYTYDTPVSGHETVSLTSGENDTSVSAGLIMTTPATVEGEVWYDKNFNQTIDAGETVASGVAVTLTGGDLTAAETTSTNPSGDYTFSGLDTEGPYTLSFATVTGYTYDTPDNTSPGKDTFTVTEGETLTVSAGLFAQATVEGEVWYDTNDNKTIDVGESAASGVAVTLTGGNLTAAETTVVGVSGDYTFTGLDGDSPYTLSFGTVAGYTYDTPDNTSPGQDTFSLSSSQTLTVNAGLDGPATIKGEVWSDLNGNEAIDSGEPGISGVTVSLTGGNLTAAETTVTDTNGDYTFTVLDTEGPYTLTFGTHAGSTYDTPEDGSTATDSFTVSTLETLTVDAGLIAPATVSGEVWYDANDNTVIDSGETAASAVAVTLTGSELTAAETAVTGASGDYTFSALPIGTYTLNFEPQPGYGYDIPTAGEETFSLTSGENDTSASAGLISAPTLDGQALIAVRGQEYDGVVATAEGPTPSVGVLDANIEWGDGTETEGTLVDDGGTVEVLGQHTYTREGFYALAVYADVEDSDGATTYAAGIADVLPPTNHQGPEMVGSVTVGGGANLGPDVSLSGDGYTTDVNDTVPYVSDTVSYNMTETVTEANDFYTLTRSGTFDFSLTESGSYFPQPNSSLTLTDSETIAKIETDGTPTLNGTATDTGTQNFTLNETGTGADYNWSQTGSSSMTDASSETVSDGTYTAADTQIATTTSSGDTNFPDATYTESWSGGESSVHNQNGYDGAQTYTTIQSESGSVTGTETGSTSGYTFHRYEDHYGTYTLSESTTNAGGGSTDSGTGSYSLELTASGVESPSGTAVAAGTVSATATSTDSYNGSGYSTLDGIVSTLLGVDRSDNKTVTTNGNESGGSYTIATSDNPSSTITSTTTESTAESADGISGSQSIGDADTSPASTTITIMQTGDMVSGSYSVHETSTTGVSDSNTEVDDTTATGSPSNDDDDDTDVGNSTTTQYSTIDRTGNTLTGSYSQHETDSSTGTQTDTSTDNSSDTPGDGEHETGVETDHSTATQMAGDTLNVTGTVISGSFSQSQTDTGGETAYATDTDTETDDEADGGVDGDMDTDLSSLFQTSGDTITDTGNVLTGTYNQTGTDSDSSSAFATQTDTENDDEEDGQTGTDVATDTPSDYFTSSGVLSALNNLRTGSISQYETDSVSSSAFETDTDSGSGSMTGDGSDSDSENDHSSDYESGGETTTITGNDITGITTNTETDTLSGSAYATSTDSDSDTPAQGGSESDSGTDTSTTTDSSTSTMVLTDNAVTGSSSETENDSSTSTVHDTSTDSGSDSNPDGSSDGDNETDHATSTQTATDSSTASMNELTGYSSQSETDTNSGTEQDNSTGTDTDNGADGSSDHDVSTDLSSYFQTSGYTSFLTDNSVTGATTQNESGTDTSTGTDSGTDTNTDSLADSETDSDTDTSLSSSTDTDSDTYTLSGDDISESINEYDNSSSGDTASATGTDTDTNSIADVFTDTDVITSLNTNYLTSGDTLNSLVNGITGSYSQSGTDTSSSTELDRSTDTGTDHYMYGTVTDNDVDTDNSTDTDTSGDTSTMTGSEVTDSYSEYETDSVTSNDSDNSTSTVTDHLMDGSTNGDVGTDLSSMFENSNDTILTTGSNLTGSYSQTESDTDSGGDSDNSTNTDTDNLSDVSTDGDVATDNISDSDSGWDTITGSGNNDSGSYTQQETAANYSDDGNDQSDAPTDYLTGGTTNTGLKTDNWGETLSATDTVTSSGNNISGSYSRQDVSTDSGTVSDTSSDSDNWSSDTSTDGDTDTTIVSEQTTDTDTGNDLTDAYTTTETGTSDPTITDSSNDQGLSGGSTDTQTESWTTNEHGNSGTGGDTTTTTDTTTDTLPVSGTDARGSYTGTSTDTDTTTNIQSGNDSTELYTTTLTSSDSSTTTISGGSGTTYTQTATDSDNSTSTTTENDAIGSSSWTSTDTQSDTTFEAGSSSTTDYNYTEKNGQTTIESGTAESLSDYSSVTDTVTSTSSLNETGSESATDSYVLNKYATGYQYTTTTGNSEDGEYTVSGLTGSGSSAVESNTHGPYSATFTEILAESGTMTELQDDSSGEYSLSQSGTNSDSFVENGTDATGTFHVTEGSFGSYDQTTVGEQDTGDYTVTTTTSDTYSYTETVAGSSPFTETENGSETASSTDNQDGVTGAYTQNTTGTDLYTLSESGTLTGGTFAETVNGTDSYTTNDVGNTALQTDTSTTAGGGNWTRTSSGAGATLASGSGTNGYTLVASGNAIAGSFSESETGTDRYGLVQELDNIANDASGSTPGNVTFHSTGLPFRDPDERPEPLKVTGAETWKNSFVDIGGNGDGDLYGGMAAKVAKFHGDLGIHIYFTGRGAGENARFLQIAMRTVTVLNNKGQVCAYLNTTKENTAHVTFTPTTDPKDPQWNLDYVPATGLPYYNSAAAATNPPRAGVDKSKSGIDTTWMFDSPEQSANIDLGIKAAKELFPDSDFVIRVTTVFKTYLVTEARDANGLLKLNYYGVVVWEQEQAESYHKYALNQNLGNSVRILSSSNEISESDKKIADLQAQRGESMAKLWTKPRLIDMPGVGGRR